MKSQEFLRVSICSENKVYWLHAFWGLAPFLCFVVLFNWDIETGWSVKKKRENSNLQWKIWKKMWKTVKNPKSPLQREMWKQCEKLKVSNTKGKCEKNAKNSKSAVQNKKFWKNATNSKSPMWAIYNMIWAASWGPWRDYPVTFKKIHNTFLQG